MAKKMETEIVPGGGVAAEIWDNAESTFVPALKKGLPPAKRKAAVRQVLQTSNLMSDRLPLINGEMLFEVHEGNYWKEWNYVDEHGNQQKYKNFDDYVEKELEMKRRKAYYLLKIYKKFVIELELPAEVLRDLSWTKAKEVTKVLDADNWKEILPKLHTMSTKEVRAMVKDMLGASGTTGGEEKFERMIFALSTDQEQNVAEALKVAQSLTGSEYSGVNIDMIATDFIAGKIGEGAEGALGKLDIIIKNIERAFGCTLEIKKIDEEHYASL